MSMLNNPGAPAAPVGQQSQVVGTKSAKTRFANNRIAAARSMLQNGSAAQTMRPVKSGAVRPRKLEPAPSQQQQSVMPQQQQPVMQQPEVGPSVEQAPQQLIQPRDLMQAHFDIQQLVNSPEFGDAITKSRLVNYFNGRGDDSQSLALPVLESLAKPNGSL